MLAIAVLFFMALYLLISLVVVVSSGRWARRRGRRVWLWGGVAAFVMYNLAFWDLIPTVVAHRYYCATEAGYWVYVPPEVWLRQNHAIVATLSAGHLPARYRVKTEMKPYGGYELYSLPDGVKLRANFVRDGDAKPMRLDYVSVETSDGWTGRQLNERIRSLKKTTKGLPFSITRHEERLVDLKDDAILARRVSYSWGQGNALSLGPRGPIRGVGTAYLAGGGGCGVSREGLRRYERLFKRKGG